MFFFSFSECIQECQAIPFYVLSYAVGDCKYCGSINDEYWRPAHKCCDRTEGSHPSPGQVGTWWDKGGMAKEAQSVRFGMGEKRFSTPEGQK